MNRKTLFKNILCGAVFLILIAPTLVFADPAPSPSRDPAPDPDPVKFNIQIKNPFSGGNNLYDFIKTVINKILIPIGGVVAVLMIMYAGFLYVTAAGNPEQIKRAHQALLWGSVGAAILLGAWVISEAIEGTIKQLQT